MNIAVKTASGRCIVRPDTTLERNSKDFFPPEFVDGLSWSPVLFARVCKAGRSVGKEFAGRYYDAVGYGILLYPRDLLDGSPEAYACASCLDHTSFLPFPLFNKLTLGQGNSFRLYVRKEGKARRCIYKHDEGTAGMIEDAIVAITTNIFIRTGDLVAIELKKRSGLCTAADKSLEVDATYCGIQTMSFYIKY